jgi:hypothetical protein
MAYSPEEFNKYNAPVERAALEVSHGIQYLLCPSDSYPKVPDYKIIYMYAIWADNARAMDIALKATWHSAAINQPTLTLPPDEDSYKPCRRMAAVILERNVRGEFGAAVYLEGAVEEIRANLDTCALHPATCPCHNKSGWTYKNMELVNTLSWDLKQSLAKQLSKEHDVMKCACEACFKTRETNGLSGMYDKSLDKMNSFGGDPSSPDFVKKLFETVQGVKYDSKCPHGDPFYACMSCSH